MRTRVTAARKRQADRFAKQSWRLNAHAPGPALAEHWPLVPAAAEMVEDSVYDGQLTHRGATRVHRVAWTVADLAGVGQPGVEEVVTALALRSGDGVPVSAWGRRAVG